MSKLGFIGLGIMGTPMALRLKAGGHDLFIHTRSEPSPRSRPPARCAARVRAKLPSAPTSSS